MATYTTLKNGSKGSDVKKLQQALIDAGYSVGKAGADGIYGSATASAVKAYQKANGLSVDGIAGNQTLGKLYGSSAATDGSTGNATQTDTSFKYQDFKYDDYTKGDAVKQAEALLQQQIEQKPGEYQSTWQNQLNDTLNKILNREKFSYDINGDALYQQYKDQYTNQGKQAMMDTMGQAAAMTGGYGNSYAQTVGQQTYQGYLQQLNDRVPELYQLALSQYNQEGQDLYNQYGLYADRENQDYGRHRDSVSDYYTNLQYLTDRSDYLSEQDYNQWRDKLNLDYGIHSDRQNYEYQSYRDAIEDERWQKEFDEAKRQFEESLALQKKNLSSSSSSSSGSRSRSRSSGGGTTTSTANNNAAFTGSTYGEAVSYMKSNGVSNANASSVMTKEEWARRKSSYKNTGIGSNEVAQCSNYKEYLSFYTEYQVQQAKK